MTPEPPLKSIRVTVLGQEYALRVREEDEMHTRRIAEEVDARMRAFREAHPEQAELTTAVIIALGLADELHLVRRRHDDDEAVRARTLHALADRLAEAVAASDGTASDDG
jgi:cell division protein ZapA